ncbi:phage tail protein [Nakamurella sp.]|uniref:phage tail protein n=1 Tax=Nakamurella sp. TaxID=1869182 RepID=UPI003B3AC898
MNPRSLALLQRSAGNAAVAGLVRARPGAAVPAPAASAAPVQSAVTAAGAVQRLVPAGGAGSTAPPVPPPAADPAADPRFRAVTGSVRAAGVALRKHPPPTAEVGKAQAAAKGPPDDKAGQAKAAQADAMSAAKPGGFDKAAFIAAVGKAIAAAAPKNLDEADKFAQSGKADGVKNQVMSQVTSGRDASVKNVKDEAGRTPDPSAGREKPVTPLAPEPAAPPPRVDGAAAMPGPAPAEQVTFTGGPAQVNQQMADAQVTEQHLEKSNEPQLQEAATAKKGAEAHAAAAPAAIRAHESAQLGAAKADAGAGASAAMAGMVRDKAGALARVAGAKTDTKAKDEVERARISGEINTIFDRTKADVEVILNGVDGKVTAEFDTGEAAARTAFTAKHKADMEKYKDDRYSGVTGAARWTADLFTGLPAEANRIYDAARALYESRMTVVISTVADLIGRELDAAKARVEKGRAQIKAFIASQPAALQKLAGEAAKDVGGKFDQLDADVDAKQQSLVDDLAGKYTEARGRVDEEIKAEQEKNKGLVDKAKEAIGGAIDTILKLKALFTGLLAKAASAFTKILDDPVGFITNFMSAVKQGFLSFAGNILTHLKKGLLGWLFGALASAGIELPDSFDLKGILKLVGSILGLTWTSIKARIAKLAPWAAAAIDVIESKIEIFTILATQGIGGLWTWIKDKLGDLKSMILTPIMDFVKEKIITAGISWVIGLLNPAGALVKIVQALVGVVQWIMERGAALMDFVGTVIDSVTDIANGGVGGVPAKIEAALGKAVPLVIAFLANLLGLGGISDKIKSILKAVQAPINKALDAVIKGALKLAGPLIRGIKGIGAKVKAKVLGGDDSPAGKQKRLEKGLAAGVGAANRFAGRAVGEKLLRPVLGAVRVRFGLSVVEPVRQGKVWGVRAEVQRMVAPTQVPIADERIEEVRKLRETASNRWTDAKDALKPVSKKIKDTRNPLAPADLTVARKAEADFAAAESTFKVDKDRFEVIRKKKEAAPTEMDALASAFQRAAATFTALTRTIEDVALAGRPAAELQAQADTYRAQASAALANADAGLADASITAGLVIPSPDQPTPAERVRTAREALATALGACPEKVTTPAQLRPYQDLTPLISSCAKVLGDARNEVKAINQVRVQVEAVDNVYRYTTNYGSFGDRTSEGAAKHEARTGEQVGHSWHGGKCRDYERNLDTIIDNLRQQRRALPAGVHPMIDEAIKRAQERRARLKEGADTWDNRSTLFTSIWDEKGQLRKR